MKNHIIKFAKFALSIWKPDFRKTMGWLFISTGLVVLSPPFIQEIVLQLFDLVDLALVRHHDQTDTLGALMVCIGILYHLFYMADKKVVSAVEITIGVLILISCALLVTFTFN